MTDVTVTPRVARLALGAFIAAATAHFAWQHVGCLYDDAFIYLRYVQVAREGCFYCFNPGGPRVEGVTSPLYFLSLLATVAAGVAPVTAVTALGAGALGLALYTTACTALRLVPSRVPAFAASAVVACLALDHGLQLNAVVGLEAALAMLVVALIARSATLPGHPWLRPLCVVGALVRPEITLFALLLPVLPSMRSVRRLAPVVVGLVATAVVRLAAFGDVLPNTYRAKAGGTAVHFAAGVQYIVDVLRAAPLCALAPAALLVPGLRDGARYLLAAAALWFAFFLRSGGDHFEYGRLAAPLVPTLVMLGVVGVVGRLAAARRPALSLLTAGALAAPIVALAVAHALPPQHAFVNVVRWLRVGRALRREFRGRTLATVPIGAISYASRAPVLDLVGLTEPAIARAGRGVPPALFRRTWIGHERHNTGWVLAQRPDVIVTSRFRARPWQSLSEWKPGFYAELLLLEEIRAGRAPYAVRDLDVGPDLHWLLLVRQ